MRGDTVVVHYGRVDAASGPGKPSELIRISGPTETRTFGDIQRVAATPDGGVVVFDSRSDAGLALHRFDTNGRFLHTIGRKGHGPGEYSTWNVSLAAAPTGQVFLFDKLSWRVSVYDSTGTFEGDFLLPAAAGRTGDITPSAAGGVFVADDLPLRFLIRVDTTGDVVDSIRTKDWTINEQGGRSAIGIAVLHDGSLVITRPDLVGFILVENRQPPLMASVESSAPEWVAGEREELQGMYKRMQRPGGQRLQIPTRKALSIEPTIDITGRIWVRRTAIAERIPPKVKYWGSGVGQVHTTFEEPPRYSGFERDGAYLGDVQFPVGSKVSFVGSEAWAVLEGATGEPVLVKYRWR